MGKPTNGFCFGLHSFVPIPLSDSTALEPKPSTKEWGKKEWFFTGRTNGNHDARVCITRMANNSSSLCLMSRRR